MTGAEFVASAEMTARGDDWGNDPIWSFFNTAANQSIDVHAKTEADARVACAAAWDNQQEATP